MSARARAPLAAVALAAAGLCLAGRSTSLYGLLEAKTVDWRFRALCRPSQADKTFGIVAVDQPSLDYFERQGVPWPWPRSLYGAFLNFARKGGAKAVVFDILFDSQSPYGHSEDLQLARAIKSFRRVTLAADFSNRPPQPGASAPPPRFQAQVAGDFQQAALERSSASLPQEDLLAAAQRIASVAAEPDPDGVFRHLAPLTALDGKAYPSLALAAALEALGAEAVEVEPGARAMLVGGRRVPLDDGRIALNFHGTALAGPPEARTYPSWSIGDLILGWNDLQQGRKPKVDPKALSGKVLLVAYTASGLFDIKASPFATPMAGTEFSAVAADNIVHGDPLRTAPWWALFLFVLAAAGAGALSAARGRRSPAASAALLAAAAVAIIGTAGAAFRAGVRIDLLAPGLALVLSYAGAGVWSYFDEGRRRRYLKGAFSLYLSPAIVERISRDPDLLKLSGERRELSIFFSDIENFTTLSEGLDPARLSSVMNRYLSAMTDIILESGGTLDKYIGDAIMAFWNAPLDCPDHAVRACRAAIANQERMVELRRELQAEGLPPIRMRIGLNSGPASVGNMGSTKRFSYTAIGDAVNLASRLEGVNKQYGTYVLLSESTRELAKDAVETRELDFIQVKGKTKPIRVYELLGLRGEVEPERLAHARRFEAALSLYRERRFEQAAEAFAELDDFAAKIFVNRCRHFLEEAPAESWDGSYALKEK